MGNPSMRCEDPGHCADCEHFRGLRTQPDGMLWTLCGQGMQTFKFVSLPPERGCRYFQPIEARKPSNGDGAPL